MELHTEKETNYPSTSGLANMKPFDDVQSKDNALQELVNTLKASEAFWRTRAEKLEDSNNILTNKLQTLTVEMTAVRKDQEDLVKRLKESEESCTSISCTLNEYQEMCKKQEILISE